jgi:hypothetical protein
MKTRRSLMIVRPSRALAGALMFCAVASPACPRQLLSIQGITLASNEYVSAFEIKTWGIRVLAVCKVPRGWGISVDQDASPEGILTGTGGQGVTWADASDVKRRFLHLFRADDPAEIHDTPQGSIPPTFNGRIKVGVYGPDFAVVWRRLKPENYVLVEANLCSDPDE